MPKKNSKLLILTDDDYTGGTAELARLITLGLSSRFSVQLGFNFRDESLNLFAPVKQAGIGTVNSEISHGKFWRSTHDFRKAVQLLDQTTPDVLLFIDSGLIASHLALKLAAAARGIPYVTVIAGLPAETPTLIGSFLDRALRSLQQADHVVLVSDANLNRFRELFPQITTPCSAIPTSCLPAFFAPVDREMKRSVRAKLGIEPSDLVCFTAGRIERVKGQELCLAALDILKRRGRLDGIKLVLAGRGTDAYMEGFRAQIEGRGLSDVVVLLGQRTDIIDLLSASDVFLLASFGEGMPISILEAMAVGLPVIASGIDGILEQVDSRNGYLLPPPLIDERACTVAIADAIDELNQSRSRLDDLGHASRARAEALFHPNIVVSQYEELIRGTIDRNPKPLFQFRNLSENTFIDLADPDQAWSFLAEGWSDSEPSGVWTEGPYSTICLPFDGKLRYVHLMFSALPFLPHQSSSLITDIFANGHKIGRWTIRSSTPQQLCLSLNLYRLGPLVTLRFEHRILQSPRQAGVGEDDRLISLFAQSLFVRLTTPEISIPLLGFLKKGWIGRP